MIGYGLLVLTAADDVNFYLINEGDWMNIWSDQGYDLDFDALSTIDTELFTTATDLVNFLKNNPDIELIEEAIHPR